MKLISLMQPWATLVVRGHKCIETRSWKTNYRGELLIHASAGKTEFNQLAKVDAYAELNAWLIKLRLKPQDYAFGAIVGKVSIDYIQPTELFKERLSEQMNILIEHMGHSGKQELAFGDYSPGRYGWMLNDAVEFPLPIPCKGNRMLWNLPTELEHLIPTK